MHAMDGLHAVNEQDVIGQEHWTHKGEVRLFLWEKYVGQPSNDKGTILFVHGSSMASQPTFDLQVDGRPFSSVMNWFAVRGFDTWCVDMEGYGRSDKHRDLNCDISNGADDLNAACEYICRTRNIDQVHLPFHWLSRRRNQCYVINVGTVKIERVVILF